MDRNQAGFRSAFRHGQIPRSECVIKRERSRQRLIMWTRKFRYLWNSGLPACVAFAALLFLAPPAGGATIVVNPGQSIQAAIDSAGAGDVIVVSKGTYTENLQFRGKNIVLRSTNPTSPPVVRATILDGNKTNSVVRFSGTESSACRLAGFTIRRGWGAEGGGIRGYGTRATIERNVITTNTAGSFGGGLSRCNGTVQFNTITSNTASSGGGLYRCSGTVSNNLISGNEAGSGGGIYVSTGTIQNNTITANIASGEGGGLADCDGPISGNTISLNDSSILGGGLYDSDGLIQGNQITTNTAPFGAGLHRCDGTIRSNLIAGNHAGDGAGLNACHATIELNTIFNNRADTEGGGLIECSGTLSSNVITSNSANHGAGVSWWRSGLVERNTITRNRAKNLGGGLRRCSGTIANNTITSNSAEYGGGLDWCTATYIGNIIIGNTATEAGGGMDHCTGVRQNNIIAFNHAESLGGGAWNCQTLVNCTVYGNTADIGGGLCGTAATNCIVWANTARTGPQVYNAGGTYSCIEGWTGSGTGNITANPRLANPARWDFHLLAGSPCIDAGCAVAGLTTDFEGDRRPQNGVAQPRGDGSDMDIGADELAPPSSARHGRLYR